MIQREISLGYGTVTKEAMQDKNLTIGAKAVYAYMCAFAGGKDEAWPSLSKMAYDLDVNRRTIQTHTKCLVDNGYIEIDKYRYAKTQQFANNRYRILK